MPFPASAPEHAFMTRTPAARLLILCALLAALFTGCSRDPNVRKQKYFESGERYFNKGKFREAAIQYANAVQIDPRFAQAHFQLGKTYLNLHDWIHAYQELSRAVELAPENYQAQDDGSAQEAGIAVLPSRNARFTVLQCDQTTVCASLRITCREEVGQSYQGRVRFFLRVRLQHGNSLDCSSGAFSAWRRWLGIFAVASLTRLPNKHLHMPIDPVWERPGGRSAQNSTR